MNQREYQTLVLGGLLHDVGKLLNKPDPHGKKHAVYSLELLQSPPYEDLLRRRFSDDVDVGLLCHLVLRHDPYVKRDKDVPDYEGPWDRPQQKDFLRCIRLADGISAGERSLEEVYGEQARGTRALDTIFTQLALGRPSPPTVPDYAPRALHPLNAFPTEGIEPLTEADYAPLQEAFKTALAYALENAGDWRALEAWIYSLLERYTWGVPSAVHLVPRDVSLFDHARTSCAIAAALALYRYSDLPRRQRTFLFIKGDVSGVQDYIYTVANVGPGGVAKRLRARSFFITALTETVSHRLLEGLVPGYRLPVAAKIMAGGGQFVLLAPNLHAVHDRLQAIEQDVNDWLWRELQGDLAVVFGTVTAGQKHLVVKPGGKRTACDVLDDLDRNTQAAKGRRLGAILKPGEDWDESIFEWQETDYRHGDCPSCRRLPAQALAETEDGEEIPIDSRLCKRCRQDRILSERIVEARYIAYFRTASLQSRSLSDAEWLSDRTLSLFDGQDARHAVLLHDLDDLERIEGDAYQLDGFGYEMPTPGGPALVRHFANHVPRWESMEALRVFCTPERGCVQGSYQDDDACGILVRPDGSRVQARDFPILQTFGCLSAAAAEQAQPDGETFYGSQLLGVLRADVDSLGPLFHHGIGEVKSLSRLATLSRMTDLFFSGWVNETLTRPPQGARYDRIYTVYAGGDDLCLVGPWDVIIDFTHHLAEQFQRYVAGNPNVTLSAAISVTKPKFPIATSARKAGQLLKAAKDAGRNRLNLFGVIARWSKEPDEWVSLSGDVNRQLGSQREHANLPWDELWTWAALLDEELGRWREAETERYPVSPGFAHRLLNYAEMARRWKWEKKISAEDMLYLARLAYDLGRNVVTSDAVPEETKRELSQLTQLSNRELMAGMRLPITYALYRNRERSREE